MKEKKMTKKEFLRLFKKYAKAVDKCEAIPLSRIRSNLNRGDCSFRSTDGYYWEVTESGKARIMTMPVSKQFSDACTFFRCYGKECPTSRKKALVPDMLGIVESLLKKFHF